MDFILEELKGWYKRSGVPHYDSDLVYQFITFRLHDSVPYNVIENWKAELSILKKQDKDSIEYQELQRKIFKYEDQGFRKCYLKIPEIYQLVESTFLKFNHVKYEMITWVIMPNHVHLLIRQLNGYSIGEIVQSWKVYTAKMANKILNRKGKFWMNDYYDRFIRNEAHYYQVMDYIYNNNKKEREITRKPLTGNADDHIRKGFLTGNADDHIRKDFEKAYQQLGISQLFNFQALLGGGCSHPPSHLALLLFSL